MKKEKVYEELYVLLDLQKNKFYIERWHNIKQYLLDEGLCDEYFTPFDVESWNTDNEAMKIAVIEQYA